MEKQYGKRVDRKCKWCGALFSARVVDVKRGWGIYCSKSCKAIKQERRTVHRRKKRQYESEYGETAQFDYKGHYVGFTGMFVDE